MKITHKTIDRVRITGKYDELDEAYRYLMKHDYAVKRSGPMMIGGGRADLNRIAITAEKVVRNRKAR